MHIYDRGKLILIPKKIKIRMRTNRKRKEDGGREEKRRIG